MRAIFGPLLGYFLTPVGVLVLGALDASLIFFLPLGIDFVLILLSARQPEWFWAYALAATAGSVAGAAVTYWLGYKIGENGLSRWVGEDRLERVRSLVSKKAAPSVAALGIIPPPFPFTAFVLASGALGVDAWRFLTALAGVRMVRFGAEAGLASRFGERITAWMKSTIFEVIVGFFIVIAVVGTVVSVVSVVRKSRGTAEPGDRRHGFRKNGVLRSER